MSIKFGKLAKSSKSGASKASSKNELNILDLTSKQTLFELAVEFEELLGIQGSKLIADLKERASDAEYSHIYYRDPIRPGIIWLSVLAQSEAGYDLPTRGKLDHCRRAAEKTFPGFLLKIEHTDDEAEIMTEIPPITNDVSAFDLVTALEYIVFLYPEMVRGWAALIFAYSEILGYHEAAARVREECLSSCDHTEIVAHLLNPNRIEV